MISLSPLATAFLLVLAVFLIGAVVAYVRDRSRFSGYQELTSEVSRIARALKGEVFRDGEDLLISGAWRELPVTVRFSRAENTPSLDIHMGAPAGFTLSVMPAQQTREVAGRAMVRTPDEMFNMRFAVRSDHPTHARLFLSARKVMDSLRTVCRSSQAFLLISAAQIEVGELGVPDRAAAGSVLERLEALGQMAESLRAMPGSEAIQVERPRHRRAWAARLALGAGAMALVVALVMAARPVQTASRSEEADSTPAGVWPVDAAAISSIREWRLAGSSDFDGAAVAWLHDKGRQAEGRVEGDFCAGGSERDVAYVLIDAGGARRLVILCQEENRYDTKYPYVGMAARIPKALVGSIAWAVPPVETPEADGLLITQKPDDPSSGLVLFPQGRRMLFGIPKNYQNLKLD